MSRQSCCASRHPRSPAASCISTPALDYGIFEKYGLKCEHIYIRGQSPALAALADDQVQFNYGAADGSLPGLAAGVDAKFVASPLVKLPYVMVARKDIRRPEDLKGKSIGVTRPGDLSARLSRQVVRKFGLTTDDVTIHPIGGSQTGTLSGHGRQRRASDSGDTAAWTSAPRATASMSSTG